MIILYSQEATPLIRSMYRCRSCGFIVLGLVYIKCAHACMGPCMCMRAWVHACMHGCVHGLKGGCSRNQRVYLMGPAIVVSDLSAYVYSCYQETFFEALWGWTWVQHGLAWTNARPHQMSVHLAGRSGAFSTGSRMPTSLSSSHSKICTFTSRVI